MSGIITVTIRLAGSIAVFGLLVSLSASPGQAQGIELLLTEQIPIPEKRPSPPVQDQTTSRPTPTSPEATGVVQPVSAISGTLEQGLDVLSKNDGLRALAIRKGMQAGSLDYKILGWAIALSGDANVTSGTVRNIANNLADWPGPETMKANVEKAMARENLPASQVIAALGPSGPVSVEGAILLAQAHVATKNRKAANQVIAPFWRNEKLDRGIEGKLLSKVGDVLTREDHRIRMHTLFYNDRITAAQRVQSKAEQVSLAKARAASIRKSSKASNLIKAVAASSRKDPAYLFTQIEHARRSEQFDTAAKLLLKAPRAKSDLIDPGEWWVERRIISRKMIEAGKHKLAYRLVADHASSEPKDVVEAEFHAGWYALRFLKDRTTAKKHFSRILQIAERPISLSRGHYWMGRSSIGNEAMTQFRAAAKFKGTYYGQLAAAKLGSKKLKIIKPVPTPGDRNRFSSRVLVKAIKRLETTDHAWRANGIYRHLAKTLTSPGELAMLAARAETREDYNLSLQVGKIAFARGYDVGTLSWPLGAIPGSADIGKTGRALAYAIARQESAFNVGAVSPANARGLLQLLPGTAKAVARRSGLPYSFKRLTRDPAYNAALGSAYLLEQLEKFANSYILTFIAYNAGPRRVGEWIERFGDPRGRKLHEVVDWVEQIPFTETRHYVHRVMENYQIYKARIAGSELTIEKDLTRGRR